MIQDIKDKIVTILNELVGAGKPIAVVYTFPNTSEDKLPSVSVSFFNNPAEDRLDTASNLQITVFLMRVLTDQLQTEANEILKIDLVEQITAKFREEKYADTLEGVAVNVRLAGNQPIYVTAGEPLNGIDMFIECQELLDLT